MRWGSFRSRLALVGAASIATGSILFTACTAKKNSEIVVAMQTDLSLPKDVDTVRIQVTQAGLDIFIHDYPVGPDGAKIPATLGLTANPDAPNEPVRVRVIARQGSALKVLRQSNTTIPQDRVGTLRMPIQWLCWNHDIDLGVEAGAEPACDAGESCNNGACAADTVDPSTLPDFNPGEIFGGGSAAGDGQCFDTIGCFAQGEMTNVQTSDCTIATPLGAGQGVNVAMVREPGVPGICSSDACFVPVDQDPLFGWSTNPEGRIALPPAVCDRLTNPPPNQAIVGVAITTACLTKTTSLPTCGPWSSVGGDSGTFTGPPPVGFDAALPPDASITLPDGGTCDPATRWPQMLQASLNPPTFGGLDFSQGNLTIDQAELVNCGGTPGSPTDGYAGVAWGPNGDVFAEYDANTRFLHSVTVRDAYTGQITMPSRPGGTFGTHSYAVGIGVLLRDGASFPIDWANPNAAVSELFDAFEASFYPASPAVTDCVQSGQCFANGGGDGGASGFGFTQSANMYFVFAPQGQTPTEIYTYTDLGGTKTAADGGMGSGGADAGLQAPDAG